jgi:hypothetical protein
MEQLMLLNWQCFFFLDFNWKTSKRWVNPSSVSACSEPQLQKQRFASRPNSAAVSAGMAIM